MNAGNLLRDGLSPLAPVRGMAEIALDEENGSDVTIATYQLLNAFDGDCDGISNDTDLSEPIQVVRQRFNIPVIVFRPRDDIRFSLQKVASSYRPLREGVLRASQLPDRLADANGAIRKPDGW